MRSQFAEKHRFINETSEKTAEASVFQTEPVACVDEGPDLPEPPTDDDGDDHGFDVTKFHVETDQEAGNSSDPAGKGPDAEDETEAEATSTKSDTYREKLLRLRNAYKKECKDMQHAMDSRRLTYSEASAYLNGIPNRTIKRDPRNSYQAKRVRLLRGQSKSLKLASYGEIPKKDRIIPIRAREIPGTREWIDFKGNDGTSARRKKNDIWRPAFCADGANFCTGFNPTGETRRFAETERKPDTGSMPRAKYHSGEGFDEVRVPFTGRPISYEGDNGVRFVHAEHLTEPASRMEALEKWAALADGNPISLTTELAPSFRFEEVMPAGENKKRKRSEVEDNEAEELKRAAKRVNEGFRFTLFD